MMLLERFVGLPGLDASSSIEVSGPDFTVIEDNLRTAPGLGPSYSLSHFDRKLTFGKCTACTLG